MELPGPNLIVCNVVLFGQQIEIVSIAFQLLKNKTTGQLKDSKISTVGNELTAFDEM